MIDVFMHLLGCYMSFFFLTQRFTFVAVGVILLLLLCHYTFHLYFSKEFLLLSDSFCSKGAAINIGIEIYN